MKCYSYVIPRDYGFAPNPYFGYCTLADCKPLIRKGALVGDWIAAFGSAPTQYRERLVVLMQINEVMDFDTYWQDGRFNIKRPAFNKGIKFAYGDNIYHHVDGEWVQEFSHHSKVDGGVNLVNLSTDTKVNRVLISSNFFYFGDHAIMLPSEFDAIIKRGRNHIIIRDTELITRFIKYVSTNYEKGIHGTPYSREDSGFAHFKGE